jgi:hypothetical protein
MLQLFIRWRDRDREFPKLLAEWPAYSLNDSLLRLSSDMSDARNLPSPVLGRET